MISISSSQAQEIPPIEFQFDSMRYIDELNNDTIAEAYPWISNDGLRLYYTLADEGRDVYVMAQRNNIDNLFESPTILNINSNEYESNSLWLTGDELNVFFIIEETIDDLDGQLYLAKRENIDDEFAAPVRINLTGGITDRINSPSLTQDLEQLYLTNKSGNSLNILVFEKENEYEYTIKDTLVAPDGYTPGTGHLTQNGKSFYLSLKNINYNHEIYVFTRENINSSFDSLYYLDNASINEFERENTHPYLSHDGRFFVCTKGNDNLWVNNDLFLAYRRNGTSLAISIDEFLLNVYPNPSFEIINFDFGKTVDDNISISIYSEIGLLIDQKTIIHNTSQIDFNISTYSSGIYFYKIQMTNSKIHSGKFIKH